MALRLIRQTSDTPNVTNKDDVVMTRYAYGGFNGVVKALGNECDALTEGGIFELRSGRIVIDGWEIDIDGEGWKLDLSKITGTQYYSIYAEVSVITESAKIDSTYSITQYPAIDRGNDLTQIQNGTARLILYNVKVSYGIILETIKRFELIPWLVDVNNSLLDKIQSTKEDLEQSIESTKEDLEQSIESTKEDLEQSIDNIINGSTLVGEAKVSRSARLEKVSLYKIDAASWYLRMIAFAEVSHTGLYFFNYKKTGVDIWETASVLLSPELVNTQAGQKVAIDTSDVSDLYIEFTSRSVLLKSGVAISDVNCCFLKTSTGE